MARYLSLAVHVAQHIFALSTARPFTIYHREVSKLIKKSKTLWEVCGRVFEHSTVCMCELSSIFSLL